jgi:hypothetical protein
MSPEAEQVWSAANALPWRKPRAAGAGFPQELNRDLLEQARERLDRVVIENVSYERCLSLYDSAFNREVFKGYKIDSVESRNGTANVRKVASRMREIIVRKETV